CAGVDQRALPHEPRGRETDLLRADHVPSRRPEHLRADPEHRLLAPRLRPAALPLVAGRVFGIARRAAVEMGRSPRVRQPRVARSKTAIRDTARLTREHRIAPDSLRSELDARARHP